MMVGGDDDMIRSTPIVRPHPKKKSSLIKLKDRKQKELGSATSLRKDDIDSTFLKKEVFDENAKETTQKPSISKDSKTSSQLHVNGGLQNIEHGAYSVSTKDSLEDIRHPIRPRPKPRGRRRSHDATTNKSENIIEATFEAKENRESGNGKTDNSDGTTIQMLRNLNMGSDQIEAVEAVIGQNNFLPKPPSTPRTPRSNPRTPRGYVLNGKGEKRIRETYSSGDEHEIEEKKDKSNRNNKVSKDSIETESPTLGSAKDLFSRDDILNFRAKKSATTDEAPHESSPKQNLRQHSNNSRSEGGSSGDLQNAKFADFVKPPIKQSLTHIDSKNLKAKKNKKEAQSSSSKLEELSVQLSPHKICLQPGKLPRSESPEEHLGQNSAPSLSENGMSREKSSPLNFSHLLTNKNDNDTILTGNDLPLDKYHHSADMNIDNSSSESSLKIQSPSRTRLDPISPRSHPPPLPENFCSTSLRTVYKIDQDVQSRTGISGIGTDNSNDDRLSQRSFTSVSVLPIITIKEARSRCRHLPEGSVVGGVPSMLGTEELDRYFPDRKVNIFVGTWNMNELKDLASSLDDFILPEKCDYVQDIYAIGTQENNLNKKEWEIKIQETVGPSHVMFHSASLGSLHLSVFIRRDLIWFCSVPEDEVISLRAVTMVKTKGAIGICFNLFGTSFLFINCHLTSDRNNEISRKKNRLGDYHKVISSMKLPKCLENVSTSEKPADVTATFDCIFWFGDLNFRIERKRIAVERKVNQIVSEEFPNFETLLGGDQLQNYMAEGKIFLGFQEGRINFHPTFKFDLDADTYDSSAKNRVPSYTDRIMFRSKKKHDVTCTQYDAVMNIKISDHRPVYGLFEAAVRPARENIMYSVGHFDKLVYTEAIRRRTSALPVRKKQSVICAIQ